EDPAAIRAIKAAVKEIDADLATQVGRLQRMYLQDRRWDASVWRRRYLDHPLMGPLARRLVWWVVPGDGRPRSAVFDAQRQTMCDASGEAVPLDGATIRLWHPIA